MFDDVSHNSVLAGSRQQWRRQAVILVWRHLAHKAHVIKTEQSKGSTEETWD